MVGRMSLLTTRRIYLSRSVIGFPTLEWFVSNFRSFRFFELPTYADTGTGSVKKPCPLYRGSRQKPAKQSHLVA